MKIDKIIINNFRSIKHAELTLSQFNIFVGQNNHGKTNVFEAINWFYTGNGDLSQIVHNHEQSADVSVEIIYSGIQKGIESVLNEKTKESFKKFAEGRDILKVIRRKSDSGKRSLFDEKTNEWTTKNFAGFDKAFNDCLPRLEYVSTSVKLSDVSKWGKKTPIGLMLSGVLTSILEQSNTYKDFKRKFEEVFGSEGSDVHAQLEDLSGKVKIHLEQQFPECSKVLFEVNEPEFEDLLRNFSTSINDGIETSAEEKGDGMQRALMLAILKTYSDYRKKNDELGKRFLFLIDEAELHLHPTAQRQLKSAMLVLAENNDQVLINTHSSVLVVDDNSIQEIFCVEKHDGVTTIEKVNQNEKHRIVYDLLGGTPSDLLLPSNFLIVEGESEVDLLECIISRFYQDKPKIQVVKAVGDHERILKNMEGINLVYRTLSGNPIYSNRIVLLCDKPHPEKVDSFNKFKAQNPQLVKKKQLFELPVTQIESYYPHEWKTEDKLKSHQKRNLARKVGKSIDQNIFEKEMTLVYQALTSCWEKAHKVIDDSE